VVILLIIIGDYSINGYWWLFYRWLLIVILLVAIGCYFIIGYWLLFYYWILVVIILMANVVIILMDIGCY